MTSFRRLHWNFALQHAADLARGLGRPLVILEILHLDDPFTNQRLHRFDLEGLSERAKALVGVGVFHYPFVERVTGEGRGLLLTLANRACCVVSDDFPVSHISRRTGSMATEVSVGFELIDSNGLLPLRAAARPFTAAYHFRRFLQKVLPAHLPEAPDPSPLSTPLPDPVGAVEADLLSRWPPATAQLLEGSLDSFGDLGLDPSVLPGVFRGGTVQARSALARFLDGSLGRYAEDRNHPDDDATSGLSPYLHYGHLSIHEVFAGVASLEGWSPLRLSERADGGRAGWWGMGPGAEGFLDQAVTWRELGFNTAWQREDHREYDSLPDWARTTLEEHEGDPRPYLYSYSEFREARTHDPLWNAAQRQLSREGRIHNYLRMLWGKKILEWTPSARDALAIMMDLNDRFALDGRDPNSYSGIFWCLGRYDRGWPERPVYGKVRSMSSRRTRKKVRLEGYLKRFG
jgi:deoxyribodipyrimidine photo-lyase